MRSKNFFYSFRIAVLSYKLNSISKPPIHILTVVDFDEIERHNLNRTPFKESQIEKQKTAAMVELISERRMDTEVIPINKRIEDTAGTFREDMAESVIIDCRDHASPLPDDMSDQVVMTAGYDGLEFTLHTNPNYENIWGDADTEYETVPSFIAPPQFVSSIITTIACVPELRNDEEQYTSGDMKELITDLLDNSTHYNAHAYAQRLAEETDGDEGEYVSELVNLAQEFEDTIDSDTAESMLEAALNLANGGDE